MRWCAPLFAACLAALCWPIDSKAQTTEMYAYGLRADVINPDLLTWPSVARELKLDPDQARKAQDLDGQAREEYQKQFKGQNRDLTQLKTTTLRWVKGQTMILRPEQMKRLRQIHVQHLGLAAYGDGWIQEQLGVNGPQQEKLNAIVARHNLAAAAIFMSIGQPLHREERIAAQKKQVASMTTLVGETKRDISTILTDEQMKRWREIVGKPFDFKDSPRPLAYGEDTAAP